MKKEMKTISARFPIEYYNKVLENCKRLNMTISDFVYKCVQSNVGNDIVDSTNFTFERKNGRPKKQKLEVGFLMFD